MYIICSKNPKHKQRYVMGFKFCDCRYVTDIVFAIQARIDCYNRVDGKNLKEQAPLAQALREDYGNTYEQGYMS